MIPTLSFGVETLTVDDDSVYFWAPGQGLVRLRMDQGNGAQSNLIAEDTNDDHVINLVVLGGHAYWSVLDSTSTLLGISTIPVDGGTPQLLTRDPAWGIATDGTSVYWTVDLGAGTGALRKVGVGGSAPVTVASGWPYAGPSALAVDATSIYWTSGNSVFGMTPK